MPSSLKISFCKQKWACSFLFVLFVLRRKRNTYRTKWYNNLLNKTETLKIGFQQGSKVSAFALLRSMSCACVFVPYWQQRLSFSRKVIFIIIKIILAESAQIRFFLFNRSGWDGNDWEGTILALLNKKKLFVHGIAFFLFG